MLSKGLLLPQKKNNPNFFKKLGLFCRGVSSMQALHKSPKKETPWGSGVSYDQRHCDRLSSLKLSSHPPKAPIVPRTTQLSDLFLWQVSGSSREWKKTGQIVDFWPFFSKLFLFKACSNDAKKNIFVRTCCWGRNCDGARFKNMIV